MTGSNRRPSACKADALPAELITLSVFFEKKYNFKRMADRTGLEPATSGVTGRHSNQLNYSVRYLRLDHSSFKEFQGFKYGG